jgi:hypothetical protein
MLTNNTTLAQQTGRATLAHFRCCCSADDPKYVVCDRTQLGPWERFLIVNSFQDAVEMTASSKTAKVALYGNRLGGQTGGGNLCTDTNPVICNGATNIGAYEKFLVEALGGQKIALRSGRNGKYCSDTPDGVTCTVDRVDTWEVFEWSLV